MYELTEKLEQIECLWSAEVEGVKLDVYYAVGLITRFFFFQAEDGIRDFCLSRGLGDVYKRQDYSGI